MESDSAKATYITGLIFSGCTMLVNPGFTIRKLWKNSPTETATATAQVFGENGYLRFLQRMVNLLYCMLLFWQGVHSEFPVQRIGLMLQGGIGVLVEGTFTFLVMKFIDTKEKMINMGLILVFSFLMAPVIIVPSIVNPGTYDARSNSAITTLIMSVLALIPAAYELKVLAPSQDNTPSISVWYYVAGLLGFSSLFANSLLVQDYVLATHHCIAILLNGVVLIMIYRKTIKAILQTIVGAVLGFLPTIGAVILGILHAFQAVYHLGSGFLPGGHDQP